LCAPPSCAPSLFRDEDGHHYEIRAELGRGVLTCVHEALTCNGPTAPPAQRFALKTVLPLWVGHPLAEARIARERELSATLHPLHPEKDAESEGARRCARVLAAGRQDLSGGRSRPFHVSALLSGQTLAERLRHDAVGVNARRHRRIADTLSWAADLLIALDRLHDRGWVHRDVKPHNVFLESRVSSEVDDKASERDGRTERGILIDFGLAVRVGCARVEGDEPFGTPAYVAPEVIAGEKLDGRADLYSVGLLLYEALAGRRPFAGRDPIQLLDAHLSEAPPPLAILAEDVSPELCAVISATLEKPPDARPATARALKEMLASTKEGASLLA
jgi:serine/threonine protein kinase